MRHPGARGFARSSAVKIDIFLLGKTFDFFGLKVQGILRNKDQRIRAAFELDRAQALDPAAAAAECACVVFADG